MLEVLGRVLNVRPHEWGRFLIFSGLIFLFLLGLTWAQLVIPAAFVEQVGVALLPYLFIGDAIAVIIIMMVYSAFADRLSHDKLMVGMLVISVIGIAIGRGMLALGLVRVAYLYLYILFRIISDAVGLHLGTFIFSYYDAQSSKRIIPLIFSVYRVAVIVAGLTVPLLNAVLPPENIVVMWALTLIGIGILTI